MKINNIGPTNFNGGIRINSMENKENQYLYNHILKITRDFKIPATFHTQEIELPTVTKDILKKLKELGIRFNNK